MNMNPTEVPTNQKYITYQYGDNKYLYLIPKTQVLVIELQLNMLSI